MVQLQVEEGTKFGRLFSPGQSPLPTDDSAAEMYCSASEVLRAAGMEHYEVSSYARPGYRSVPSALHLNTETYLLQDQLSDACAKFFCATLCHLNDIQT